MLKRMVIMLLAAGLLFGGIFGYQVFKARMIQKALSERTAPAQTVATVTARFEEWQQRLKAVGNVRAVNGASLAPEVSGTVVAIHFKSGMDARKGDLLLELTSAADAAQLEALKANAVLAKLNYQRDVTLRKQRSPALSKISADTNEATMKNAEALVKRQRATLDYKFIRAPFSGRLGIVQVDLGQYISAGTAIVSLQQLDPIHVDFYLPQQALARIKTGLKVTASADAFPGRSFAGTITAIDSAVDTTTRNIKVRATFPNPDKLLLPGMFATVDVDAGEPQRFLTLPKTAIAYNSFGDVVFLVEKREKAGAGEPQLVARQVFVTTGAARGGQVAVIKGVKEGDVVVTTGQIKLRNGVPVKINNSVRPSSDPHPAVADG